MNLNIFKKRTSPKEALRTSKREMAVATRGIEREIASLQMEEKNLVAEIKKTAKTGNEKNYMMQYLVSKVSRRAFSPAGALYRNASFSSMVAKHYTQKIAVPSNFLKWGSLGFCRTLSFATGFTPLQPKPLETIIDVARAKNKSPEELADIWDDFHLGRGHIGLSMKTKLYHLLEQRATDCRYFVIPLWKGRGYTTMFVQVQLPHMLFTGLEDYKARGTQAAPYLTASYYKEFADTKDLVLIRGDVVFTSKLSDDEAKWLLETAQSFYLNDVRYKLVECFNKETREFEFKDVLTALEMPIL